IFFFFSSRRRHTRSKRDWSSDVCSSDLMSAATFSNVDYWLTIDGEQTAMNTARSIRFTVRNNTQFENGQVDRISDVDLQSTLRRSEERRVGKERRGGGRRGETRERERET